MIPPVKLAAVNLVPALALAGAALTGCATIQKAVGPRSPSATAVARLEERPAPGYVEPSAGARPQPFASTSDGRLWLVLLGSGSCRSEPVSLRTDNIREVEVTVTPPSGSGCTDDLVPNVMSFPLAGSGLSETEPILVHVKGLAQPLDVTAWPVS